MGSRWEEHPGEEEDPRGLAHLDRTGASAGLEAAELDLLRSAPDYDAEEMASVRPSGGWPGSPSTSAPVDPPASSWVPPNRIEPPARASSYTGATLAAAETRSRFPEERTMARMAEDLIGRPLDEPAPSAGGPSSPGGAPRSACGGPAADGTDVWDFAMPL